MGAREGQCRPRHCVHGASACLPGTHVLWQGQPLSSAPTGQVDHSGSNSTCLGVSRHSCRRGEPREAQGRLPLLRTPCSSPHLCTGCLEAEKHAVRNSWASERPPTSSDHRPRPPRGRAHTRLLEGRARLHVQDTGPLQWVGWEHQQGETAPGSVLPPTPQPRWFTPNTCQHSHSQACPPTPSPTAPSPQPRLHLRGLEPEDASLAHRWRQAHGAAG